MGSFLGHLLPGLFFVIYGIWLSIKQPYRHFSKQAKQKNRCGRKCSIDMIEACAKIFCPSFGILMEQVTNNGPNFHLTNSDNQFWDGNNWSHCTMYLFFVFTGIADILVLKFPNRTPAGINYLFLAMAFLVEGYLFYFHTHGRDTLEVRIHVLLVIAIWTAAVVFLLLWILTALQPEEKRSVDTGEYMELSNSDETIHFNHKNSKETLLQQETSENEKIKLTNDYPEQLQHHLLLLEMATKHKQERNYGSLTVMLHMIATIAILLQGTWFFQIAGILYPPGKAGWDVTVDINIEFATTFFTWHLAALIVYTVVCYYAVGAAVCKRNKQSQSDI